MTRLELVPSAIIETATDIEVAIVDALNELRDAENKLNRAADTAERRRVELGGLLFKARKRWPASGPKAKGWGEMLSRLGIDDVTAWRYMRLAGAVPPDGVSFSEKETPTYAQLGMDNRPRASDSPFVEPGDPDYEPPYMAPERPKADRDAWCTPKWLAKAVGRFDLDPCTNNRSHIEAKYSYDLARGENGLELASETPKHYRVWCNPPFSDVWPWVDGYKHTRFTFLVRNDTSTAWFDVLDSFTQILAIPRRDRIPAGESPRVEFEPPPGVEASSPDQNHILMYAREDDVSAAIRRMCRLYRKVR